MWFLQARCGLNFTTKIHYQTNNVIDNLSFTTLANSLAEGLGQLRDSVRVEKRVELMAGIFSCRPEGTI